MGNYWKFLISFSFLILGSYASQSLNSELGECGKLNNGCSNPVIGENLAKYKKEFHPACAKHDICYACGEHKGWTRKDCDKAFLRDMNEICHHNYNRKRFVWSLWNKFKAVVSVGTNMAKWWFIPEDTRRHCVNGANIFFRAVDAFAGPNYGDKKKEYFLTCQKPCARLGNPHD